MTGNNSRPKILIVDDEEKNIRLMALILEKHDYNLETAKNGLEAIKKTVAFLPDLIFLV
jgi:CheY-like chemotaxis protein